MVRLTKDFDLIHDLLMENYLKLQEFDRQIVDELIDSGKINPDTLMALSYPFTLRQRWKLTCQKRAFWPLVVMGTPFFMGAMAYMAR